jgi:hypothetical protein
LGPNDGDDDVGNYHHDGDGDFDALARRLVGTSSQGPNDS